MAASPFQGELTINFKEFGKIKKRLLRPERHGLATGKLK
jgi:hypothetical protein